MSDPDAIEARLGAPGLSGWPNPEHLRSDISSLLARLHEVEAERDAMAKGSLEHRDMWLAALAIDTGAKAAEERLRQIHASHDTGHKAGAWPNACMGCDMFQALRLHNERVKP